MDPNAGSPIGAVGGLVEALWLLKPIAWRDYERWLGLMTACKFEGIDRATFVHWSIQDERYADEGAIIARLWDGVRPEHGGALWAALSEAGIKVNSTHAIWG